MNNSERKGFFRTGNVSWKVITILVAICLMFSVGLAAFAQPLAKDLFNIASSSNNADWNISFTKVIQNNITGNAKEIKPVSYTSTTASFAVELTGVGDSISYDFTITNSGKLDAKVESIYIVPANKENDALLFYTSNLKAGDTLLAGESKNLKVNVNFNQNYKGNATDLEKDVKIWINFVQN